MSSFVMPNSFSTPNSTGSPWVSQPALRFTKKPFMVLKRQNVSLIERARTWWIPGCPLAEGGPSKKINEGQPSRSVILLWKTSASSHIFNTSLFTSERFSCVRSANRFAIYRILLSRYFKILAKIRFLFQNRKNFNKKLSRHRTPRPGK